MDAIDIIHYQTPNAWTWQHMTVEDVTQEQADWQPPTIATHRN